MDLNYQSIIKKIGMGEPGKSNNKKAVVEFYLRRTKEQNSILAFPIKPY